MANELEQGGGGGGGGAGGKLRTSRSTRRANTPYDRPQTGRHAPAVVRAAAAAAAESSRRSDNSNGRSWLSRIVDPASRIISNGARRWFSSVFQKRLTGPPSSDAIADIQEDTLKEVAEETVENAMVTEEIDQEPILVENQSEPEAAGLDVLLKDKTLSRDEFNRLIELLETRVVDCSSGMTDYEVKTTEKLNGGNAPINAANAEAQRWRDERKKAREEKDKSIWDNGFPFNPLSPVARRTLRDDAGSSPADIAKAFMVGSHRAPMSTSAMRCRPFGDQNTPNRLFRDEHTPNISNVHQIVPRTESLVFGNGQAEDRFKTPHNKLKSSQFTRSQNRVQGMGYTPYSRNLQQRVHIENMGDGSSTPATRWTPIQSPLAGGRQMLKRRSSVLDDGMMSVGPIRRTRHKSNFHTPLRNSNLPYSNGNQPSPSLLPGNDYGQNALTSFRKPLQIEKQNDVLSVVQPTEDATKDLSTSLANVPQQSSETARRILEQLDRMVPSPKEKSAEAKLATARVKSPTLLSASMLNGHARRSTETINSIPILHMHGLDSSPLQENKQSRAQGASGSEQKYEGKGKSPLLNSVPTSWGASTSSDTGDVALQSVDVSSSKVDKKLEVDSSLAIPIKIKGFRMSAPEESDEEGNVNMNATVHSQAGNATFTSHENIVDSKTFKGDKAITSTSTIMTTKAEAHALTSAMSVVQSSINNSSGFSFPVSPVVSNFPEPPTPTPMPSPIKKANTQPVEETSAPTFNFGSENTSKGPVFSFPASGCTDVDITKPEFGFKFESKPAASFSTAVAAAAASSAPALPLQTTLGSLESSALIFEGPYASGLSGNSSSAPSSSTVFSSTNVATYASSIPLFSGATSKTDGMNLVSFSSSGMSSSTAPLANDCGNLTGLKSDIHDGTLSGGTDNSLKCFTNRDQNSVKSENDVKAGIISPMSNLFGLTNAASSASSNTSGASNSTSNLLPSTQSNIVGSLFGQASCSAPVTTSAPLLFGSSGGSFSLSGSVPPASSLSTSLSVSFGGTSPLLFGSTSSNSASSGSTSLFGQNTPSSVSSGSFPSFGLGSSSFGTSISTPFGSTFASGSAIASTFGPSSNLSLGSSGTGFSGSNTPTFGAGVTPQFGANTSSFGLITSSKFGSSSSSLSGLTTNSHIGSNTSVSTESSSSQFGSSPTTSFGSGVAFSSNATSFPSVPTFSFSGSTSAFSSASTFGSGSSPSFIGSSPSFGSGSIPAFGGVSSSPTSSSTPAFGASSASFGSASTSPFGGSSSLFGSASTPTLFGSSSIPQFGLGQSFGASSSTSSVPSTIPSFGSGFGTPPVSASTGFSFGGSSVASSSSFAFGASGNTSAGTTFSFNSASASPSTLTFGSKETSMLSQQSNFGLANTSPMFGTTQSSTPTDQMEDSMAEDPAQVTQPDFGGQPASCGPGFAFNSQPTATLPGQNVFQFGAQPSPAVASALGAPSTFNPPATGLDFSGGSFSLGAVGDKPGRKFIKARRDKGRRK